MVILLEPRSVPVVMPPARDPGNETGKSSASHKRGLCRDAVARVHGAELAALRRRLRQLGEQQAGLLPGDVLQPLADLPRLEELPEPSPGQVRDVLDRLVIGVGVVPARTRRHLPRAGGADRVGP